MLPEISLIGQLEALDEASHRLQSRLTELPKLLAAEKKEVEEKKALADAARARLQANETERTQLEKSLAAHQSKLAKLKKQIDQAASEAQVQAFEHEINFATHAISSAEDRVLTLMMEAESLTPEIAEMEQAHAAAHKLAVANFRAAAQEHAAGQQTIAANQTAHKDVLARLPAAMAQLYTKLRKRYKSGPLIAEAAGGLCGVCQIEMRLAFWQRLQAEPEAFYECEECGRVLVYNKPVAAVEG